MPATRPASSALPQRQVGSGLCAGAAKSPPSTGSFRTSALFRDHALANLRLAGGHATLRERFGLRS